MVINPQMERDKELSSNCMVLSADEVGFTDLLRILFHRDVDKRELVKAPGKNDEDFDDRRWLIFLSILAQKTLLFSANRLASVGAGFETWLNLLDSNQGFARLLINSLTGRVLRSERGSSTFLSYIGHQDTRWALDSSIKHGDSRSYPALSMMAAKLSYENPAYVQAIVEDRWKMHFLDSSDFWNAYRKKATTQASMFCEKRGDEETIVVAFRGTSPFDAEDWASDFDISWHEICGVGKLHGGFMKALGLQTKKIGWPWKYSLEDDDTHPPAPPAYYAIRDKLKQLLEENNRAKFVVTGHSLGGALAILFPAILIIHKERELLERMEGVYTFGQPRVGDKIFGQFMENKLKEFKVKYLRYVYCNDMVPRLPMDDSSMFKHFGTCIYHNSSYVGKVVDEEPNKNYFSLLHVIPKVLNSCWELIRSFTIGFTKGPDYKEGWFLRMFRVIGLVVPGVSAHSTQDYVNATRLSSPDILLLPQNRHT